MKKPHKKSAASLTARLTAATLAIAALAPLPAALAPFGGIATVHAQSNPCAPTKPVAKAAPANPCAPMSKTAGNPCAPKGNAATNPCAPNMQQKKEKTPKADKRCETAGNPCAPARKCDGAGHTR